MCAPRVESLALTPRVRGDYGEAASLACAPMLHLPPRLRPQASVKKALDDQKRNKRRTELDSIERKVQARPELQGTHPFPNPALAPDALASGLPPWPLSRVPLPGWQTLLRWNGSCSVVEYVCERPPTMPPTTWEKQHKAHEHGQVPPAHSCPCSHPPPQRPTRLLGSALWAREESPRCLGAEERLQQRPGACPKPPISPPLILQVHNGQCPICIEDFNEGDRVWRTPCAHAACEDCLEPYLRPFIDTSAAAAGKSQSAYAYAMCALCRAAFDPEEKKAAELAQEADRSRREQENSPPATQENTASATVLASTRVQLSTSSNAAFPALGITAPAESSQAGASSAPPTPEITTALEAAAMLFCAGLSDNFCGADGKTAW